MVTVLGLENLPLAQGLPHDEDPITYAYRLKIAQFESESKRAFEELNNCRMWLVMSFVALAPIAYLTFSTHTLPYWTLGVPIVVASIAYREAGKRKKHVRDAESLLDHYRHRVRCASHKWMGEGDSGQDLEMAGHLSARDVDLFGKGSLFELLCDVGTPVGRETLARWLQVPASKGEAIARQEAIRSLRDRAELREKLVLLREGEASVPGWNALRDWLVREPIEFPPWSSWVALLLSLCMIALGGLWWMGVILGSDVLPVMGILGLTEAALALWLRPRVKTILYGQDMPGRKLESVRRLCALIETESFDSQWLLKLQQKLNGSFERIGHLQKMVGWLELRWNDFAFYILPLVMWTTQWTMRIERWRARHRREFLGWLTALGEFEALVAIAAYAYEHPQNCFPAFSDAGPLFEATGMGHPLMDFRICVINDVKLGGDSRFLLVTGSNMSGKSTLLRAAGLNATLAWMGAPVRATALRLSQLQICASIRVEDSLLSGRSRFYVEVERLKAMLDRAASGPSPLFLIDELLGGTNSADRRVAAEAVIRILVERQAIGLDTSHDLALAEIAEKQGLKGANVHFSDKPTAEGLSFDYRLRPGKVDHSNALKILNMMGIPLNYTR